MLAPGNTAGTEKTVPAEITDDTDIDLLLEEYSSADLCDLLEDAFAESDDRVALARKLLSNYSGYPRTRAGVEVSSAMAKWPADFVAAVINESPTSDHDRLISRHLALQYLSDNRAALVTVYESLEPGSLRSKASSSLCRFDFETGGLDASLKTISSLPFQSEKLYSLIGVLNSISSAGNSIKRTEIEKIETFTQNWKDKDTLELYWKRFALLKKIIEDE